MPNSATVGTKSRCPVAVSLGHSIVEFERAIESLWNGTHTEAHTRWQVKYGEERLLLEFQGTFVVEDGRALGELPIGTLVCDGKVNPCCVFRLLCWPEVVLGVSQSPWRALHRAVDSTRPSSDSDHTTLSLHLVGAS